MNRSQVHRMVTARVPIAARNFKLSLYHNGHDSKEHLALIRGDITGQDNVMVRIHSECFTGDVMASERCDCGEQLSQALEAIDREGCGAILYLRQEGRGIGLLKKLEAYNLQDLGYDTVDANRLLGHAPDERDYSLAASILKDLQIRSIRLLTNNPAKVKGLQENGIEILKRVPIETPVKAENAIYLRTKANRMNHHLEVPAHLSDPPPSAEPADCAGGSDPQVVASGNGGGRSLSEQAPNSNPNNRSDRTVGDIWISDLIAQTQRSRPHRPAVTLTYAQSVDGCIAVQSNQPLAISGPESMALTHGLRAAHDAILVGVGTVLADNPRLTVRLVEATNPQPIVLDTQLRTPPDSKLMASRPWIATTRDTAPDRREALEAAGATILQLPITAPGRIDLDLLLQELGDRDIGSLMVEGGATVISSFLASRRVDTLVITVAPTVLGGLPAVHRQPGEAHSTLPRLYQPRYEQLGEDLIVWGEPEWA